MTNELPNPSNEASNTREIWELFNGSRDAFDTLIADGTTNRGDLAADVSDTTGEVEFTLTTEQEF